MGPQPTLHVHFNALSAFPFCFPHLLIVLATFVLVRFEQGVWPMMAHSWARSGEISSELVFLWL